MTEEDAADEGDCEIECILNSGTGAAAELTSGRVVVIEAA